MNTIKRTDLVNYLVGVSVALFIIAGAGYIGIGGSTGDKITIWFVISAVAIGLGYGASVGINILQGQNHQSGDSANSEEERTIKGAVITSIITSGLFSLSSIFVKIPEKLYGIVSLSGLAIFVIAFGYWGLPTLIKKT